MKKESYLIIKQSEVLKNIKAVQRAKTLSQAEECLKHYKNLYPFVEFMIMKEARG